MIEDQPMAPLTLRFFIGALFICLLLATPALWTWFRHRGDRVRPEFAGVWVGRAHITGYTQPMKDRVPLDKMGIVYIQFTASEHRMEDYRGKGELKIEAECPRRIDMAVSLAEWFNPAKPQWDGGLKLSGRLGGDLETERPGDDALSPGQRVS